MATATADDASAVTTEADATTATTGTDATGPSETGTELDSGPPEDTTPSETGAETIGTSEATDTTVTSDTATIADSAEDTASDSDIATTDTGSDDTTTGDTIDTTSADTADTTPADTTVDVDVPDPCTGPDRDGDGIVDACDRCPDIPNVLVFDINGALQQGRHALDLLGCEYTVAGMDDFVPLLDSGRFGAAVLDMPDARPEGEWAQSVFDFIQRGGAVVLSSWRLDRVAGPNLPATFGASLISELTDPQDLTPTWVAPLYQTPFDLSHAIFWNGGSQTAVINGATLAPTAGRVWAHFSDGAGAIVESNGGRTFLDGFLWDDYPFDTDGDGHDDMAELVANQLTSACRARLEALGTASPAPGPSITNLSPTEVTLVRNDLVIARGSTAVDTTEVTSQQGAQTDHWPVADRRWKALIALKPGDNWVSFTSDDTPGWTHLQIRYTPQTNPRSVRFVYAVASDGDGHFDAPIGEPNDLTSATQRIATGARLLQAIIADRFAEAGLERRTIRVEPNVIVWKTSLATAGWWAMSGADMWSWIWGHMNELPACSDCKTVIILGMTHYDAAQDKALAHTALGGGGVALFGSGTLHTWAQSLDEIPERLDDTTDLPSLGLFDDSAYRRVAWANYATGLGAVLHELGHALDLPHPTDSASIMNRGFDHVNRLLTASEPPSANSGGINGIWPVHEPTFDFSGLYRLRYHRWLAQDARVYTVTQPPTVTLGATQVNLHSAAGIRVTGYAYDVGGDWRVAGGGVDSSPNAPVDTSIPYASLRFLFPDKARIRLLVTDDQGNTNDDTYINLGP